MSANDTHLLDEKRRLLAALLAHVPFDGWTAQALSRAAADAGFDQGVVARAFPGGAADALDFWVAETDAAMLAAMETDGAAPMKLRERIAAAVMLRLDLVAPHREAVRRALALEALPQHAPRLLHQLYRTVDAIWYAAGDTSTDFNFYTKRLLLAGVYSATLLHWLDDKSEGFSATRAFLGRRIGEVMQIQKARGRLTEVAGRLPNPWNWLRKTRPSG